MIRVWARLDGAKTHDLVATLDRHRSSVNALALSSDGSVLYSGACDRSVLVWERDKSSSYMAVTGALRGHERAILCLACVGELVISGSGDRTVRIWRREGFRMGYSCLAVMEGHARGIKSLAAVRMPNSDEAGEPEVYRVCSGSLDGEVMVWRVRVSPVSS
ncbi:Guanine nucleotide-binding protein subunit beta-like protein [Platanthera zijinensis]|uniref:Guanine nucleotide-binding protein subunit beta-like protein n=1 Tax=Platanthera zijinensis TaxID=2320716 RepID=A0AAP0B1Y4_9ASPA